MIYGEQEHRSSTQLPRRKCDWKTWIQPGLEEKRKQEGRRTDFIEYLLPSAGGATIGCEESGSYQGEQGLVLSWCEK